MKYDDNTYEWVIYLHRNMINGKVYIGRTTMLPSQRWKNGHGYTGMYFKRAIDKYGWDNFSHIILEEFTGTQEEAGKKEQQYIEIYKSQDHNYGYNIKRGDEQVMFGMNEASVKWMAEHPEFGLARAKDMHRWRQEHPEEALSITLKMQQASAAVKRKKVRCVETGEIFESMTKAAQCTPQTSESKISMCCAGKRNTSGGYHWQYVDEENDKNE